MISYQKGRFTPIKSLKNGHKFLGASLYLISNVFGDGDLINQDYFQVYNKNIIPNYNGVLCVSAKLLENFFNEDNKEIPNSVLDSLSKNKF